MTSIAHSSVSIQASPQSAPSLPCWFGEATLIARHLQREGVLAAIEEQVRFARRRFGQYEVIDCVAVLLGSARSVERTLEAFDECLQPWADTFMALFGRDQKPSRSTLSRLLAALDQTAVESLRTLFLKDGLSRPLVMEEQSGGMFDRQGNHFLIFDVDGTREAASPRARPQTADRPAPSRRLRPLCAAFLHGRQARGSRAHAHRRTPSSYAPMACPFRQPGPRRIPGRAASGSGRDPELLAGPPSSRGACRPAPGWAIWHRSCPLRSGGTGLCDAWQRLSAPGSSRDPSQTLASPRSTDHSPGKWNGAHPLRLF